MSEEVVWATPMARCPCGARYRRWSPKSGARRSDGARYGSGYCRPCARAAVLRWQKKRRKSATACCSGCGNLFHPTNRVYFEHLHKRPGDRFYCTKKCYRDSTRKYADRRERARESKRRQRAARRARGLNAKGLPFALKPGDPRRGEHRVVQPGSSR